MQSANGFLEMRDGRRVEVADGLTIGRTEDCDLILDDHKVSRHHARVIVDHGVVEIEDLGSSNGVLLNGRSVQRHILRSGDELRIGTSNLAYRRVDEPSAAIPAVAASEPKQEEQQEKEPDVEVIEFIDEVVKVRARELPKHTVASHRARPGREGSSDHGILQFSKRERKSGKLNDDLGQLGSLRKILLILVILLASVGLAWLAMFLVTV